MRNKNLVFLFFIFCLTSVAKGSIAYRKVIFKNGDSGLIIVPSKDWMKRLYNQYRLNPSTEVIKKNYFFSINLFPKNDSEISPDYYRIFIYNQVASSLTKISYRERRKKTVIESVEKEKWKFLVSVYACVQEGKEPFEKKPGFNHIYQEENKEEYEKYTAKI